MWARSARLWSLSCRQMKVIFQVCVSSDNVAGLLPQHDAHMRVTLNHSGPLSRAHLQVVPTHVARAGVKHSTAVTAADSPRASLDGEGEPAAAVVAAEPESLLPRVDLGPQLGEAFAKQMDSVNWKERNAAMESVEEMIRGAGGRITPNVGELVQCLKVSL